MRCQGLNESRSLVYKANNLPDEQSLQFLYFTFFGVVVVLLFSALPQMSLWPGEVRELL